MPKKDTTVVIETTQKVNNPDGTQSEITVKERRLKKNHDKQMARIQSRQRRAANDFPTPQNDTENEGGEESETVSSAALTVTADANASEMRSTLGKPSKADRRKKPEPSPAPETESPAADSETGDPAAE